MTTCGCAYCLPSPDSQTCSEVVSRGTGVQGWGKYVYAYVYVYNAYMYIIMMIKIIIITIVTITHTIILYIYAHYIHNLRKYR